MTNYAKTVSWTPKGEAADLLYDHCLTKSTSPDGDRYTWLDINPQDVVRDALEFANVINKQQPGSGDKSDWEIGKAVKTSLWNENVADLTQFAKEQGMSRQDVIRESVIDFLLWKQV